VTTGSGTTGNVAYWDIGVRGDTGPQNHNSTVTLTPMYSVLTDVSAATGYAGATLHNTQSNPTLLRQYCDGARVPPENGGLGYNVPPGIADATVPNPIFNLTPAATVDEGNNWINIGWGPLSLSSPATVAPPGTTATPLGNYGPAAGSPVANYVRRRPSRTRRRRTWTSTALRVRTGRSTRVRSSSRAAAAVLRRP